jgi:hypothetical protein
VDEEEAAGGVFSPAFSVDEDTWDIFLAGWPIKRVGYLQHCQLNLEGCSQNLHITQWGKNVVTFFPCHLHCENH